MYRIAFLLFAFFAQYLSAQDTAYARKVLNDLCSPNFSGRAYVKNGDKKASDYIASQFKIAGLKSFNNNYFQNFNFSVNTFPKTVEVTLNGVKLIPGVDYLVDPSSPSCHYKGVVDFVPISELDNETHYDTKGYQLKAAVLDTFTPNYYEEAAITLKKYGADYKKQLLIRLTNDKLTWSSSSRVAKVPGITLLSKVFDRSKPAKFEITIKNKFYAPYTSRNVIGYIEGTKHKDSFIVVTGHYDHLGMMGNKAIFPGANDNASGIAMLLNLAKYYKENPQSYSVVFIAFSGEETGLIGSKYFVDNPVFPLSSIHFLINVDLMGNGAEGVMTVNGMVYTKEYLLLKAINEDAHYLPAVKARGKAKNSDHYWFSEAGVPSFFFYLLGPYPYYHDVNDKAANVPLTNFSEAFMLFRDFISAIQKPY
jgi:aminopeptidase YwaD